MSMSIAEVRKKYDFTTDTPRNCKRIGLVSAIGHNAAGIRCGSEAHSRRTHA
jgi:hypothetical protein